MKQNEFYLNRKIDNQEVYRITLGDLILESDRKIFPEQDTNLTGSIGFMDIIFDYKSIPKKIKQSLDIANNDSITNLVYIGVEPKYQGKGFSKKLLKIGEKLAKEKTSSGIYVPSIQHQYSEQILINNDYNILKSGLGTYAFKRL